MRLILTAAVMCALVAATAIPATAAYTSDGQRLLEVDLLSGVTTEIGAYGEGSRVWSLALSPQGVLYGIDDIGNRLVTIDRTTGQGVSVGALGLDVQGGDLTFDACGELWFLGSVEAQLSLLRIDPSSAAATLIRAGYDSIRGIAAIGESLVTVNSASADSVFVLEVDRRTGELTALFALNNVPFTFAPDLGYDASGVLWGVTELPSIPPPPPFGVFAIDPASGDLVNWQDLPGFVFGLAIDSPTGICLSAPVVDIPAQSGPGLITLALFIAGAGLVRLLPRRQRC